MASEQETEGLAACPFCGNPVEERDNLPYAPLIHHPPYDRRCPLADKFFVRSAWQTRPASEDDEAFCAKVWEALAGDHTDLRKQAIILEAHREARTPSPTIAEADRALIAKAIRDCPGVVGFSYEQWCEQAASAVLAALRNRGGDDGEGVGRS